MKNTDGRTALPCNSGVEFHHLETGTLKIRHMLSYLRLMYHHHILTRNDDETIKKFYIKQKESKTKGDWFQLLQQDFQFIEIEMNEGDIKQCSKTEYKNKIRGLIQKAAFKHFLELKSRHTKLTHLNYTTLQIQPYLTNKSIKNKEAELLYNLRSNCYKAKYNFKKMYKNNILCEFGCPNSEDQYHIFKVCKPIQDG